jgi:hypothetical protein
MKIDFLKLVGITFTAIMQIFFFSKFLTIKKNNHKNKVGLMSVDLQYSQNWSKISCFFIQHQVVIKFKNVKRIFGFWFELLKKLSYLKKFYFHFMIFSCFLLKICHFKESQTVKHLKITKYVAISDQNESFFF